MANLLGANIGTNYKGFLNLDSTINTQLDATLRAVTDGMGTISPLQLSTTLIGITSSLNVGGVFSNLARLHIKGSGTTSATTSLLVQNSAGTELFKVFDDGQIYVPQITGKTMFFDTIASYNNSYIGCRSGFSCGADLPSIVASAALQVNSVTQGFLPPRLTTAQKNAIASPASGLQVYDATLNQMSYYNGTSWINV